MPLSADIPANCPAAVSRERIASVDTLRGLVITLMIFVNDAAGVVGSPGWLRHVDARADAMTLPDVVFPAFLFIAGMSIPLALGWPEDSAAARCARLGKIAIRVLALLVMGVLMVNMEEHTPWRHGLWSVLAYVGIFLTFAVVPSEPSRRRTLLRWGRWVGAAALLTLALVYTNAKGQRLLLGPLFDSQDTVWLRHSWWGILGLIGWAYLVAALVYLAVGRRREWLLWATAVLMLLFVSMQADYPARLAARPWLSWADGLLTPLVSFFGWLNRHVSIGEALGSHASITTAGVCLGSILLRQSGLAAPAERLRWAAGLACGLLLGAVVLDANYGLNKIQATPAWCWLCAALTTGAWKVLYWWMDLKGHVSWSRFLQPAGANPLLAYVLHPFTYLLTGYAFSLLNPVLGSNLHLDFYKDDSWPAVLSLLGCLVMALAIVQLTGVIARAGYRLKA